MPPAQPTDRSRWPETGPHLQLLKILDALREASVTRPSFRVVSTAVRTMLPASHEAVRSWLTGRTLPSRREVVALVAALGGGVDDRDRALRARQKAEEEIRKRRQPKRDRDALAGPYPPVIAGRDSAVPGMHPSGQATITAKYDVPGDCSTKCIISGDLNGDPRATGKALWIAAVLSAPPNVLYYPKMRVAPQGGRFTVTIPPNTQPGVRRGRFGLIISPSDQADSDLQQSKESDEMQNDSLYPDTRRIRLQLGNVELATTPFVDQRC